MLWFLDTGCLPSYPGCTRILERPAVCRRGALSSIDILLWDRVKSSLREVGEGGVDEVETSAKVNAEVIVRLAGGGWGRGWWPGEEFRREVILDANATFRGGHNEGAQRPFLVYLEGLGRCGGPGRNLSTFAKETTTVREGNRRLGGDAI